MWAMSRHAVHLVRRRAARTSRGGAESCRKSLATRRGGAFGGPRRTHPAPRPCDSNAAAPAGAVCADRASSCCHVHFSLTAQSVIRRADPLSPLALPTAARPGAAPRTDVVGPWWRAPDERPWQLQFCRPRCGPSAQPPWLQSWLPFTCVHEERGEYVTRGQDAPERSRTVEQRTLNPLAVSSMSHDRPSCG
jgi:hypothetical protein